MYQHHAWDLTPVPLKFYITFLVSWCVYAFIVGGHVCAMVRVYVLGDTMLDPVLSFYHEGSRGMNLLFRLCRKSLYPLVHLSDPSPKLRFSLGSIMEGKYIF